MFAHGTAQFGMKLQNTCLLSLIVMVTLLLVTTHIVASDSTGIRNSADHPVSVVDADVFVSRKKTIMKLTPFAEDLELLQGCSPLDDGFYDSQELLDATKDHAQFLAEKIELFNAEGEKLVPKIVEVVDIEFPEPGEEDDFEDDEVNNGEAIGQVDFDKIETDDQGRGRIRSGELMKYRFMVVLEFKYDDPPPFLTINQEMVADGALLPSELKILLKQAGDDTPYGQVMKPSEPQTFRFDWDQPGLGKDASAEDWEAWMEKQREQTLGITSYSSIYSFLYIERFEVRHEVLVPLATMTTIMDLDAESEDSWLTIEEQEDVRDAIGEIFVNSNPIEIDGIKVKPVVDRVDFYGLDLKDFAIQAEPRSISIANGRIGIILSYSTKGTPEKVFVTWEIFNNAIRSVDSVILAFDNIVKQRYSKSKGNTYEWILPEAKPLPPLTGVSANIAPEVLNPLHSQLVLHGLSLGLVGLGLLFLLGSFVFGYSMMTGMTFATVSTLAACFTLGQWPVNIDHPWEEPAPFSFAMADSDADTVFSRLHKNMFRAFDYHTDSDIYDALANSVDGELLRTLYLEINDSLKVKEQGGSVARIDNVVIVEGKKADGDRSEFRRVETPGSNEQTASDQPENIPAFNYHCKWNLIGTIEHWGHIHQRTNQYSALFRIELRDDAWKITEMKVNDLELGPVKTDIRRF